MASPTTTVTATNTRARLQKAQGHHAKAKIPAKVAPTIDPQSQAIGKTNTWANTLQHPGPDEEDMVRVDSQSGDHGPQREPAIADHQHTLIPEDIAQPTREQDESPDRQAVTRGKPGQNSRIGDVKSVADDIEDGEGLGKTDLGGELGQTDKANDEDFSRQGDGVL
ncbi:hypothetical protein KC342_g85 [Hortaea werneckii]|nr:hypothetical protein KC342_g85 [Hortaea werneckii]